MPMPWAYRHASKDWQAFLADAKEALGLSSDNMTYTAVQGVLTAFRARLAPREVMAFADLLPAVLRALFVAGWDPEAAPKPWADRATLEAEARGLRPDHNLTPDHAIEPVAIALRRALRQIDLDRLLERIGPEAEAFWRVTSVSAGALERRIV
ncbi:DUF2267 domain-containing protein [Sinisalibacter aestuarii]|uniref:DUF2267 domain-containing protein n=1 Tax=Sinisalibacter aestuarii TaxID=2949426 RepID=A0ABQ5LUI5_9RHOB|nr:DUF2267 domain-containing protein [Sinisalibacter aestuarii]GKY88650.1 hypothetical protein STA1M1_25190 [Sinisalibacter aestuarii]